MDIKICDSPIKEGYYWFRGSFVKISKPENYNISAYDRVLTIGDWALIKVLFKGFIKCTWDGSFRTTTERFNGDIITGEWIPLTIPITYEYKCSCGDFFTFGPPNKTSLK